MDIGHEVGTDLTLDATGALTLVTGDTWTQQRILRRLLTNPGDYIWDLPYGGGLRQMIGSPALPDPITAVIRNQMALESSVAASPSPRVSVSDNGNGLVGATIVYTDAQTAQASSLGVSLGSPT